MLLAIFFLPSIIFYWKTTPCSRNSSALVRPITWFLCAVQDAQWNTKESQDSVVLFISIVINGRIFNFLADPCHNYRNLSEADRKSTYNTPDQGKCDGESSSIISGEWYRFVGDAGTKMPTQCVPGNKCGAVYSGWLKGGHPTLADGEVLSKVCFTRSGDCCKKSINIKVKDCGSYFIYKLLKLPACPLRYCGTD